VPEFVREREVLAPAARAGGVEHHAVVEEGHTVAGATVGALVGEVLDGADPATTPVVVPEVGGFDINVTKLEQLGLEAPQSLLDQALSKI